MTNILVYNQEIKSFDLNSILNKLYQPNLELVKSENYRLLDTNES